MGYTTYFEGKFTLDRPLSPEHRAYLENFSRTRRVTRDANKTATRPDPIREAVGLPVGLDGAYFIGAEGDFGQEYNAPDITNYNRPPGSTGYSVTDEELERGAQPGLWCQWVPNADSTAIVWNECEKFYEYDKWIVYIIENFLKPWGYALNGEVCWHGEDSYDRGTIYVKDNTVEAVPDSITNPGPSWR